MLPVLRLSHQKIDRLWKKKLPRYQHYFGFVFFFCSISTLNWDLCRSYCCGLSPGMWGDFLMSVRKPNLANHNKRKGRNKPTRTQNQPWAQETCGRSKARENMGTMRGKACYWQKRGKTWVLCAGKQFTGTKRGKTCSR